jgi:hypothetical protein
MVIKNDLDYGNSSMANNYIDDSANRGHMKYNQIDLSGVPSSDSLKGLKKIKYEVGIDTGGDASRHYIEDSDDNMIVESMDNNFIPTSTVSHGPSDRYKLSQINMFDDFADNNRNQLKSEFAQKDQIIRGNIDFGNVMIDTYNSASYNADAHQYARPTAANDSHHDELLVVSPIVLSQDADQFSNNIQNNSNDVDRPLTMSINQHQQSNAFVPTTHHGSDLNFGFVSSQNFDTSGNVFSPVSYNYNDFTQSQTDLNKNIMSSFQKNSQANRSFGQRSIKSNQSSEYLTLYPGPDSFVQPYAAASNHHLNKTDANNASFRNYVNKITANTPNQYYSPEYQAIAAHQHQQQRPSINPNLLSNTGSAQTYEEIVGQSNGHHAVNSMEFDYNRFESQSGPISNVNKGSLVCSFKAAVGVGGEADGSIILLIFKAFKNCHLSHSKPLFLPFCH